MLTLRDRVDALLLCGFRPFFLFTAGWGALAAAAWLGFLTGMLPLPSIAGGPVAWHAREMMFGFGLAALAGFVLTAIPEFTGSAAVPRRQIALLAALWSGARLGVLSGTTAGAWVTAATETALLAILLTIVVPRLRADPARRQFAFLWGLAAMLAAVVGHHVAPLGGGNPLAWVQAALGVMMVFIVVALSRISMRIVNEALVDAGEKTTEYLARPPRRTLAIFCIALYTAAELVAPAGAVSGWVALAASAALFNLLNDWHLGRVLFSRWVLMLYGVYWMMALGYGLIGMAVLADVAPASAGRHLLAIGAMGLSIFVVMNIAGRIHAGVPRERGPGVPLAAGFLVAATLLRATLGTDWLPSVLVLGGSALLWIAVFALHFVRAWPLLSRPRTDGQAGCAGVMDGPDELTTAEGT